MGRAENGVQSAVFNTLLSLGFKNIWRQNNHAVPIIVKKLLAGRWWQVLMGWRLDPRHRKGKADISGILKDGRRLEVETKAKGGKLSPEQIDFRDMILQSNGVYIEADSVDALIDGLKKFNLLR